MKVLKNHFLLSFRLKIPRKFLLHTQHIPTSIQPFIVPVFLNQPVFNRTLFNNRLPEDFHLAHNLVNSSPPNALPFNHLPSTRINRPSVLHLAVLPSRDYSRRSPSQRRAAGFKSRELTSPIRRGAGRRVARLARPVEFEEGSVKKRGKREPSESANLANER